LPGIGGEKALKGRAFKARRRKWEIEKRGASRNHDEIDRECVANEVPQGLKPVGFGTLVGASEAAPFQNQKQSPSPVACSGMP
jgi:hypothetical protein